MVGCDHAGDLGISDAAFSSAVLRLRLSRHWRFGYGGCDSTDPRCDYAMVDCMTAAEIDSMSKKAVLKELRRVGKGSRGTADELRKKLKKHYRL